MKYLLLPLTLPLSLLYNAITRIRNKFFDWGWSKELEFEVAIVSVGNLAVGGSGKTPHVAYLIDLFQKNGKKVAVLSRGYGRASKGFIEVKKDSKTSLVGDEMKMLKSMFPDVLMGVQEIRVIGISELLATDPDLDVIILDDAYQHRHVKPKVNILLSEFKKPFFKDFVMPLGRLREARSGYNRADMVVYTKCPKDMDQAAMINAIGDYITPTTWFSKIDYPEPVQVHGNTTQLTDPLILTAIAKPEYLEEHLKEKYRNLNFTAHQKRDHASFGSKDISLIQNHKGSIICTQKDWVKLQELDLPGDADIWVQPISVSIGIGFDEKVLGLIKDE